MTKPWRYFTEDTFFVILMLAGLIAALVVSGCGPSTQDVIKQLRKIFSENDCDITLVSPEARRAGEPIKVKIKIDDIECVEKKQ